MLVLLLAVLWSKIRRPLLGGLCLFLLLLLIMSMAGCTKIVRVPCGPDPDRVKDIELPARPVTVVNGSLADDLRLLRDRVAEDTKAKADLREELRSCLK